ncbi:Bifunctional inhibitor/lipid-transfer protein/seed storage 2S albumin superfamily protein [Euphorbia peplus]|nr:Bifunctional inhibitor/lipid-transfer protein/seed storage 2S albumin superfamily protein [Euphorbia peplus]
MKFLSFSGMKALAVAVMVLVILSELHMSDAANCNISQLRSCAPAMSSNATPSRGCCNNLIAQQPCLCGYMKDPSLKQFVSSPGAQRVSKFCGISIPRC